MVNPIRHIRGNIMSKRGLQKVFEGHWGLEHNRSSLSHARLCLSKAAYKRAADNSGSRGKRSS